MITEKQGAVDSRCQRGWPPCGARLRGPRAGRTCRAPGSGFSGRCLQHGGALRSAPVGSNARGKRQVVLFTGFAASIVDELLRPHGEHYSWGLWAIPLDLIEHLPSPEIIVGADAAFVSELVRTSGVSRHIARRWPARIGYRVIKRLLERGQVAYALLAGKRDLRRATRKREPASRATVRRVESDELLAALRATGQRIPKEGTDA